MQIKVTKREELKEKPDFADLPFAKYYSDYMFQMKWTEEKGWFDAEILPHGPITLEPSAMVFHYGLETFEGMKAYKNDKGEVTLFRPLDNFNRMNRSNDRLCMPPINPEEVLEALKELLKLDSEWIPTAPGTSLYVRPFTMGTEPLLVIKPASECLFMIICTPVGAYCGQGLTPTDIYVESEYVRATVGGTGEAKCGGNYAASIKPYHQVSAKGYAQVLFLDAKEQKYIEEIGSSNVMFVINDTLITPSLSGTILPGITRDSILTIARDKGYKVEERMITIDEVVEAHANNTLTEVFATGTAAIISSIGKLTYKGKDFIINDYKIGEKTQELYDTILGIQTGKIEDKFGWVVKVN